MPYIFEQAYNYIMSSVEKALNILKILAKQPYEAGVTDLAEQIACGKSGTHKLLAALVQEGFVMQKPNRKYCLGISNYLIGKTYEEHVGISRFCKPYLVKLRDMTNENASLGMWVNGNVTMICKEESTELIRVVGNVAGPRPFNASSIGKTLGAYEDEDLIREKLMKEPLQSFTPKTITSPSKLLEEFAKIREQGYAISDEEYNLNIIGVGAPVRDANGKVWAAISLSAPKMRVDKAKFERMVFLVTETAKLMSNELKSDILNK